MNDIQESKTFSITLQNNDDVVDLDNKDVIQCYFIEDIYQFIKTGKLIFKDTDDIVEFLPLMAGEMLTIVYATTIEGEEEYEEKTYNFIINKICRIEQIDDNKKLIELLFVEQHHYALHYNHFSLSFYNEKYSDIVKHIITNHLYIPKMVQWENSKETLEHFYTGQKTPSDNIKWLMRRCSSIPSGQAGYLLYSNTKETELSFNFISLETLLSQKDLISDDPYSFDGNNPYYVNKILNYQINQVDYNSMKLLSNNTYLGFDNNNKKFIKNEYNYKKSLKNFTILGEYSLFNDKRISIEAGTTTNTGETNSKIMDNMYYDNWIKQYCLQQIVTITVKGHNERYAGGMIVIDWPSNNTDSVSDKNMSGKYLIKSITHNFTPQSNPQYVQRMALIKNGYDDTDNIELTKSTKSNL